MHDSNIVSNLHAVTTESICLVKEDGRGIVRQESSEESFKSQAYEQIRAAGSHITVLQIPHYFWNILSLSMPFLKSISLLGIETNIWFLEYNVSQRYTISCQATTTKK